MNARPSIRTARSGRAALGAGRWALGRASGLLMGLLVVLLWPAVGWAQTPPPPAPGPGGEIVEYYATDALGSIRVVFTASGAEVARADYLPFGERFTATGPLPPQQFTGQQRDPEAQLDHFNARSYQTTTGRFTGIDPVYPSLEASGLVGGQEWNRYSYVRNNPLRFRDPTGRYLESDVRTPGEPLSRDFWAEFDPGAGEHKEYWGWTPSYQERFDAAIRFGEATAVFDGSTLTITAGRFAMILTATSGRPGYQGPEYQHLRNKGPIPEGEYVAKQESYQEMSFWQSILGLADKGKWPGGYWAWGDSRVWLDPLPGTQTYGRSDFSIHGGLEPGSAGCIDLTGGMPTFSMWFRRYGADLPVTVKYPVNVPK